MSLSPRIREQFEKRIGSSISDLAENTDAACYATTMQVNNVKHEFGRGYVHFGRSICPEQKDKENLAILESW